jgi:hypothetical protein
MVASSSFITYYHLVPWLHGNLVLVDLIFNFDDLQNDFYSNLDRMLERFEGGDLKEYVDLDPIFSILMFSFRWSRFLVIITTHSDPETGYLHIAPNNTGSVPVNEVSIFIYFIVLDF